MAIGVSGPLPLVRMVNGRLSATMRDALTHVASSQSKWVGTVTQVRMYADMPRDYSLYRTAAGKVAHTFREDPLDRKLMLDIELRPTELLVVPDAYDPRELMLAMYNKLNDIRHPLTPIEQQEVMWTTLMKAYDAGRDDGMLDMLRSGGDQ